jgi:hypothetical protein
MKRATTAHRRITIGAIAALAAIFIPRPAAVAASDADDRKLENLQKELDHRNELIQNLLHRVEKLEREQSGRRAGPPPEAPRPTKSQPTAAVSQADQPESSPPTRKKQRPVAARTQGSPAADGPGQFTVSPDAAEHALERALVQTGALLLQPWKAEFVPGLNYQLHQVLQPNQLALTTSGSVFATGFLQRFTELQASGLFRLGLPYDSQFELSYPLAYKSLSNTTQILGTGISQHVTDAFGTGDPTFALTKQVMQEGEWLPNLFVSGLVEPNWGMTNKGVPLGMGFDEFKLGFVATKRQDPLVFTAGFSYQTALENKGISPGDQYTPSAGFLFAVSPQTSLQFSQQVTFVNAIQRNNVKIPGSNQVQGIFNVGLLSILAPNLVVNLSAGIGETPDAPDLTVMLSFPIKLN